MTNPIDSLPPLRDVIAKHDLLARKSLGQHFLCDLNLTRKIAELAGDLSDCTVFEVGPGPGGLTRALLATQAKKIIAIEKDRRCIAALQDVIKVAEGRLEVIEGDALKMDLIALALQSREREGPKPEGLGRVRVNKNEGQYAIVANLPYNIGTELLLGWLKEMVNAEDEDMSSPRTRGSRSASARHMTHAPRGHAALDSRFRGNDNDAVFDGGYRSLTLMFQSEVADRLTAEPGSKIYGRLSVIAQFCCDIGRVLDIPARAFTPPPKVDSAVVHLTPRKNRPKDISFEMMGRVTAAAFGQRRKMLRSSLKPLGGEELLKRAGINPELRAENLSVAEFEELAKLLDKKGI